MKPTTAILAAMSTIQGLQELQSLKITISMSVQGDFESNYSQTQNVKRKTNTSFHLLF